MTITPQQLENYFNSEAGNLRLYNNLYEERAQFPVINNYVNSNIANLLRNDPNIVNGVTCIINNCSKDFNNCGLDCKNNNPNDDNKRLECQKSCPYNQCVQQCSEQYLGSTNTVNLVLK